MTLAEIAIPNIDPPVFLSMLEFLYTGSLELKVDTVFQIYNSADQYLLEDVKTACRSFINLSMTQEHALTLLENARMCKFMEIYQVAHASPHPFWGGLPSLTICGLRRCASVLWLRTLRRSSKPMPSSP